MASESSAARRQPRKLRVLACEACRSRRTRCDGRKPTCGTCDARGCLCLYPEENKRTVASVEEELSHIRSQLDRIENVVTAAGTTSTISTSPPQWRATATSPSTAPGSASSVAAPMSPGRTGGHARSHTGVTVAAKDFPYMKLQTAAFNHMAGLGEDYGNLIIRLEQSEPLAAPPSTPVVVLKHTDVVSALQSFSARIHPWYPILEDRFSDCAASVVRSFTPCTDAFLVLTVLASGAIAQETSHSRALRERPDAPYLNRAMEMFHMVVLEQTLRSVQCLVSMTIHYYLLLRPTLAHDLVVLAIKKAQNLHLSGALRHDQAAREHWIRVYRIALLIEAELVVPLRLVDTNAWETEEEIPLPTGTDIWTFDSSSSDEAAVPTHTHTPGSTTTSARSQTDDVITYLLAEVAMRRMLRRNTTAITVAEHSGQYRYAPLVARELEAQLEQWCSYLPEQLRFPRESGASGSSNLQRGACMQTPFLRTQYWAGMVSFYWPSVVQVMESQQLDDTGVSACNDYFRSYREFIKCATGSLDACLPNKWTIYASIFSITLGAYMGASDPLLAPIASRETWDVMRLARDSFSDECRYSPSLRVMAESIRVTISTVQ